MRRLAKLARIVVGLAVVAAIAGGGWWLLRGAVAGTNAAAGDGADASETSGETTTAAVERRTLTVTEDLDATLGYAGSYEVPGGLDGTLTWTVEPGTVVEMGAPLYEVDGRERASLMFGSRPAWRTLDEDVSEGPDVRQLEENLLILGYLDADEVDRHWDDDTTAAVEDWQDDAGLAVDGELALGEIVFLPEAIRVTEVQATLGARAGAGGAILAGTSHRRAVTVDLDAADHELLEVGDAVDVELPDGSTVGGTVAAVSTVAETASDGQGGTTTTLPVTITLDAPGAGGSLDEAPVEVIVVTERREDVLTVPVSALVALLEGGYAVEVVDDTDGTAPAASGDPAASPAPSGSAGATATRLVPVEPGLFDRGYVEITADGLEDGDLVVVPS